MSVCAQLFVEFNGSPPERRLRQIQAHVLGLIRDRGIVQFSPDRMFLHPVAVTVSEEGIERCEQQWSWQEDEEQALNASAVFEINVGTPRAYTKHYRHGPVMNYITIFMGLLQQPEVIGVYCGYDDWHRLPRLREPEVVALLKDFAENGFHQGRTVEDSAQPAPECPFCAIPMRRTAYGGDRSGSDYTVPFTCDSCDSSAQIIGYEALNYEAGRPYRVSRYLDFDRNLVFAGDGKTVMGRWTPEYEKRWWELQAALRLYDNQRGQDALYLSLRDFFAINGDSIGIEIEHKLASLGKPDVLKPAAQDDHPATSGLIGKVVRAIKGPA